MNRNESIGTRFSTASRPVRLLRFGLAAMTAAVVMAACGGGDSASDTLAEEKPVVPDVVIRNADVRTMEAKTPRAEAIAVKDGKIIYVGSETGLSAFQLTASTQVVDANQRLVLPAFSDTHNHVSDHPEQFFWVNTREMDIAKIGQTLQAYRAKDPGVQQIRAIGWDIEEFLRTSAASGKSPAQLLDEYVADIPVLILSNGHHDMVANSLALGNAKITDSTPDPAGAIIERVAGTPGYGQPSGIVHEFGAMSLLERALPIPDFTVEQFRFAVLDWQKVAAAAGITSVLVPQPRPSANFYEAMKQLDNEGKLSVRYSVAIWADEHRGKSQVPEMVALRQKYTGGKNFKIDTIKFFANGDTASVLVWDQTTLNQTAAAVAKEGFRIYVHDIGPFSHYAAVLDAIEYAQKASGRADARHVITHVEEAAINEAELQQLARRFKELDVIADGHPPQKAFFDAGVQATSSSDYPVRNPFFPMTRIGRGVVNNGVSVETMVTSHTLNGARLLFAENETGSLKVGKSADIVMMDKNMFNIAPSQIRDARPAQTFFRGQQVYKAP